MPDNATLSTAPTERLRYDDPGMRRVRLGLFAAALATFALLYTPQPLLPLLSADFRAGPAAASLVMAAGTGALALGDHPVSSLSEVLGRRRVMVVSALAAALLGLVAPLSPSLGVLVAIRVAQGFALAGVPAVAMAYLAEEVEASSLGRAMGLYIAGNAIGGLSGRVIAGGLAEHGGWRVATAGSAGSRWPARSPSRYCCRARLLHPRAAAGTRTAGQPAGQPGRHRAAAALPHRVRADGRVRHGVQLPDVPAERSAVPAVDHGHRRAVRGVPRGDVQFGRGGPAR